MPASCRSVDLWEDNLDPHSKSFLRVRVLCTPSLIVAYLRCFVRVNGVRVRLLDTRFVIQEDRILRVSRPRTISAYPALSPAISTDPRPAKHLAHLPLSAGALLERGELE